MSHLTSHPDLVVFSHLRWDFVYQRPQHLMSRLAGRWRIWFVEEPVLDDGPARLVLHPLDEHLTVIVPHTPVPVSGFHDDQIAVLTPLLASLAQEQRIDAPVAWLYTPMALPLLGAFNPTCVAYDCMEEPVGIADAPRQLRQREQALMRRADLVLTAGPSLFEAKRHLHPQVQCVPSSVDAAHFAPDRLDAASPHAARARALQAHLPHPRLGFFGVIDERMDLDLVDAVAAAHPEWHLVMAGPVVGLDAAKLPQRANVHWLGMQPYERLPYLLAGWDICLMPFALNEVTRFINPTQTLEYMAGGKPVVSTAVTDVLQLHGHVVQVADDAAGFVQACEQVWASLQHGRCPYAEEMLMTVNSQSWRHSADTVHQLLVAARQRAARPPDAAVPSRSAVLTLPLTMLPCTPAEPLLAVVGAAL